MNNGNDNEKEQSGVNKTSGESNKVDITPSESGSGDPGRTPGKAEGVEDPEVDGNQ